MGLISLKKILSTDINDLPGEKWKEISGYNERYQVSNYGRIKSTMLKKPIILKKKLNNGRFEVVLTIKKGLQKKEICGRLVAKAFIREPEENEVLHPINGNVMHDNASNLKWVSKSESTRIAINDGRRSKNQNRNEKNGMAILSKDEVLNIREMKRCGSTYADIKRKYNVSLSCIQKAVKNQTWKNI